MPGKKDNVQEAEPEKYKNLYYKRNKNVPIHVNVDIGKQKVGSVGANLSSRMPVGYVDEKGNIIKGFFTQNESVNSYNLFQSRFETTYEDPGNEQYKPIADFLLQTARKEGFEKTYRAWCKAIGLSDDYVKKHGESADILSSKSGSTEQKRNNFLEYLKKNGVPEDLFNTSKSQTSFWNYMDEIISTSAKSVRLENLHTGYQRQGKDTSINKRNNAMYDYARILGFEDLICKSSSMTVIKDNKKLEGSFMVNAKGTDHDKWDPRLKEMGSRKLEFSARAIRDISNLQIMDYLCANIDRHPGNMFYELDYSDPNKISVKGIQGIDNDASFGQYEHRKRTKGYFSALNDIRYIDSEMAERIMKLKPEEIDAKIRLAGLSDGEIQAAHTRLADLQNRIRDNKMIVIQGESSWNSFAQEMNGTSTRHRIRVADDNLEAYNIFDNAAFAVEQYNNNVTLYKKGMGKYSKGEKPAFSNTPTIGISKTSFEHNTVDVHKNELKNVYDQLTAEYTDKATKQKLELPEGIKNLTAALKDTIDYMQQVSDSNAREYKKLTGAGKEFFTFTLNDMQRNKLAEMLSNVRNVANAHITDASSSLQRNPFEKFLDNHAKNIAAYVDYAKESIQNDAVEAEKNLASRMAEAKGRELDAMKARQTLPALLKAADDVDSAFKKSSSQFKNMVSALKTLDQSKLKTIVDKQVVYNKLIDLANKYIEHKLPEGKTEKDLSNYERNRVNFARDIIGFSETCKQEARMQEKASSRKEAGPKPEANPEKTV